MIDKQKVLDWLDDQADKQYHGAVYTKINQIYKEIESGRFDIAKVPLCPLCGHMDCECEDILTKAEYDRLVEGGTNK